MNKTEAILTELLNLNAFSEKEGVSAKDMAEILGFNASARLSELKARQLVTSSCGSTLSVYWLTKRGTEKAKSLNNIPTLEQNEVNEEPSIAPIETTDLNHENLALRNALEYEKSRVKALEQNARELNARIAALESHQDLICEDSLLEQVAELTNELQQYQKGEVSYSFQPDINDFPLIFTTKAEAIEQAHKESAVYNKPMVVSRTITSIIGTAKPIKTTIWEAA